MSSTTKKIFKISGMMAFVIILFVIVVVIMTYFFNNDSVLTQAMRRIVPMPAATIDRTHWVSSAAVDDNVRALRHQYESPQVSQNGLRVDFSTPEGQKRLLIRKKDILNKMVEDQVIIILAKDHDLTVYPNEALLDLQESFVSETGGNDIAENIRETYGWDTDTYMERMLIPSLYRQALTEWFYQNSISDPSLHEKIVRAKQELDDQRQFNDVVKRYSEPLGAQNDGEMGWFANSQLMEEISVEAFAMNEGAISAVIESPIGFHIIRLNEIKEADDQTPTLVNLSQIFVAKKTFGQWLEEQMRTMKFSVPSREFTWDDERQVVDFTSDDMRTFEIDARNDPQGDASLF